MCDRRRQLGDRGGEDWNKDQMRRLAAARQDRPCCSRSVKFKQGDEQRDVGPGLLYTLHGGTREERGLLRYSRERKAKSNESKYILKVCALTRGG